MATSSIFTNFTINDEQSAKQFVNALDEAHKQPSWHPSSPVNLPIRDPAAIRDLLNKKDQ